MEYTFKQDDEVFYDNGFIKGVGKIIGICTIENPIIGGNYILEPINPPNISSDHYPFKCFSCFENQINKIS